MQKHTWIKTRLKELGLNQTALASALGVEQPRISEIIGNRRRLRLEEVPAFADVLQMSQEEIIRLMAPENRHGNVSSLPQPETTVVMIVGKVKAGFWMSVEENVVDADGYIPVSTSAIPADKSTFALRVEGDSMNRLFGDGDILICVPLAEFDRGLVSGMPVIVDRFENGQVESTVKEYEIRDDGSVYLWPRSTNPEHQAPIRFDNVPDRYDDGGYPPVSIRAVVLWAMKRFA
ncbi:MAG: LexA family transcriptional regulator [Pseudomonadota bacterium]|nr:LexA family transcriptional regulator [Pseudomonadota bacterium]